MLARESKRQSRRHDLKLELPTDEIVEIKNVETTLRVSKFKLRIEKEFGIPCFLQRLSYLDAVDLPDDSNLEHSDVVPGATIRLSTWSNWDLFLCAALQGDLRRLLADGDVLGMTNWHKKRAWTLTYLAAHYGHFEILLRMLGTGAVSVNDTTESGRTPLHAAAYRGNWKCLCALLEKGADITITDNDGRTALDLSKIGSKETCRKCEKSLNFCAWNLQKKEIAERNKNRKPSLQVLRYEGERRAHQFADSTLQTWYTGEHAQIYMSHPTNPVSLPPQKKTRRRQSQQYTRRARMSLGNTTQFNEASRMSQTASIRGASCASGAYMESRQDSDDLDGKHRINKQAVDQDWFDPQRAREFVPTGRDLLAYSADALHKHKHIPARVIPSPASLLPPKHTPSPCIFEKWSVHSRADSRR